jgi:hypothetical protein
MRNAVTMSFPIQVVLLFTAEFNLYFELIS